MLAIVLALLQIADTAPKPVHWYLDSGACQFGMVVGAAGDVNRDGVPDFVVGDEGMSSDGLPPTFWIVSPLDGAVIRRIVFPPTGYGYWRVEGGTDFDADHVPDLLISRADWDAMPDAPVHLVSGATGEILRTLTVHASQRAYGTWARIVSDRDGDERADVATISMGAEDTARVVTIWSSASGAKLLRFPIEAKCGAGRCTLLEVRSPAIEGGAGMLVFLDGGKGWCLPSAQLISSSSKTSLWVHHAPERYDGGYGELAVLSRSDGAPRIAVSFYDHVDVLNAITGECDRILTPRGKTDMQMGYGWSLASLGDVDGDGADDLAIAETEADTSFGTVYARSGKSGKVLWTTEDEGAFPLVDFLRTGYQLSAIGDVDGDGVSELIGGSWTCKSRGIGRAFLISGKHGILLREFRRDGDGVSMLVAPKPSVR